MALKIKGASREGQNKRSELGNFIWLSEGGTKRNLNNHKHYYLEDETLEGDLNGRVSVLNGRSCWFKNMRKMVIIISSVHWDNQAA